MTNDTRRRDNLKLDAHWRQTIKAVRWSMARGKTLDEAILSVLRTMDARLTHLERLHTDHPMTHRTHRYREDGRDVAKLTEET